LPDGSAAVGHLIYHQEHYDLAFFRVRVDQPVPLPSFNDGVKCGQLVFWLGRDANVNITMTHLRPGYYNASMYEKPHLMFFPGKERTIKVKAYFVEDIVYYIHYLYSLSCFCFL
jgi:hypothetical protein